MNELENESVSSPANLLGENTSNTDAPHPLEQLTFPEEGVYKILKKFEDDIYGEWKTEPIRNKSARQIQQWAIDTLKEVLGEEEHPEIKDPLAWANYQVQEGQFVDERNQFRQTILKDFTERIKR